MRSLEDNPVFNAGHGSCLNKAGEVEMDAIITDGSESPASLMVSSHHLVG